MLWVGSVRKKGGEVELESDGVKHTIAYTASKVVLRVPDRVHGKRSIFLREGEIGLWSFVENVRYKPSSGGLWIELEVC